MLIIIAAVNYYKMSASEVYNQFHPNLVEVLPMNDQQFLKSLVSSGLLSVDLLNQVETKETPTEKAKCFLVNKISHDVSRGYFDSFYELLNKMKDNGNDNVQALAIRIKNALKQETVVSDDNNAD